MYVVERNWKGKTLRSLNNVEAAVKAAGLKLSVSQQKIINAETNEPLSKEERARIEAELKRMGFPSGQRCSQLYTIASESDRLKSTSHVLSYDEIMAAYQRAKIDEDGYNEHPDSVRIAYEWLDAQRKLKSRPRRPIHLCLKHIIEAWGGRYVSQSDVEVAAFLHPDINGKYPYFNLSNELLRPYPSRFEHIGQYMRYANSYATNYITYDDPYTHAEDKPRSRT